MKKEKGGNFEGNAVPFPRLLPLLAWVSGPRQKGV